MEAPTLPEEDDGTYLETLNWVCKALGWADEGRPITRAEAPGPQAFAMFNWASTSDRTRKDFFNLWTTAHKRPQAGSDADAVEVARQDGEIRAMLAELPGAPQQSGLKTAFPSDGPVALAPLDPLDPTLMGGKKW